MIRNFARARRVNVLSNGAARAAAPLLCAAAALLLGACATAHPGGIPTATESTTAAAAHAVLLDPGNPAFGVRAPSTFLVKFVTSRGSFTVEAHRDWAPLGTDRFYNLTRLGFFDGQRFFRVRARFIAQFGLHPAPDVIAAWYHNAMADDPRVVSNARGTMAYAMTGPGTRTTQIYISLADNSRLDGQGFAPFATVVRGMDVVDKLYAGYGESAGGGVRGDKQGPIESGGNAWLIRNFPKLDYIVRATIVTAP